MVHVCLQCELFSQEVLAVEVLYHGKRTLSPFPRCSSRDAYRAGWQESEKIKIAGENRFSAAATFISQFVAHPVGWGVP
jgi:hypothetical protein